MKYNHNQICTKENEVVVGNLYQYKEDSWIADVKVIKDTSDEKGIRFDLKIVRQNFNIGGNGRFSCWAASGHYAYSGMWRLYDAGTYLFDPSKAGHRAIGRE